MADDFAFRTMYEAKSAQIRIVQTIRTKGQTRAIAIGEMK